MRSVKQPDQRLIAQKPRLSLTVLAGTVTWCLAIQIVGRTSLAHGAESRVRSWEQIEADWLRQAEVRWRGAGIPTADPREDALGAVDGVKDGKWGFHTAAEVHPWWQVDLGRPVALDRVLVFNRCDAAGRAVSLALLLSNDGENWTEAYRHDGQVFFGHTDGKPLEISLDGATARFLRLMLTQDSPEFFHLDEVEVYAAADPERNIALGRPATQSSVSPWSYKHELAAPGGRLRLLWRVIESGQKLSSRLAELGLDVSAERKDLDAVAEEAGRLAPTAPDETLRELYLRARRAVREMALRNPVLNFDDLLFVKRAPGMYSHMSDQNYGWWSRPGGGIFILRNFRSDNPELICLTPGMENGSFGRPDISFDGSKIVFSYCRYYPEVAPNPNKFDKATVPEDAFYHLFEMNLDGTGLRQITRGRYDDFEPQYLPDGRIVFLSTRRGWHPQYTRAIAELTLTATLGDGFVRCGGDAWRPVSIYTLHVINPDGTDLCPLSPFENFEWSPAVGADGRILFARWDYVDRSNMPYMSLWATNPDGTDPRIVYGNFTPNPHCIFEARPIPGSNKLIFTASAHHSITGGSLVLLDPDRDVDGNAAILRLTPEVCFPESEGWPQTYYANPWPLSEDFYLVSWSDQPLLGEGSSNPLNARGIYLYDAFGNLELLYRDRELSCWWPMPLRSRPRPPVRPAVADWEGPPVGRFLLLNVYDGLAGIPKGTIKRLRIVGVPPKTQPWMNTPNLGLTGDDPGKFVIGHVPVEEDGSAHFVAPAAVCLFFQALDAEGVAVQTMRSATYLQPGEFVSCAGCHESRLKAPPGAMVRAALRPASKLTPGPEGSWPMRYDRLVQPVLDRLCVRCHNPEAHNTHAAAFDLSTPPASYERLISWGSPCLRDHVRTRYAEGRSVAGQGAAATNPLLAMLREGHAGVKLEGEDFQRLAMWMDLYGQRQGHFSEEQEQALVNLRDNLAGIVLAPASR
ncbi:MAG: discoidin domain-containing protein [Armatimonadetes bacterium]|nr:discoidin domain-containing protein [Armatimonadota bacterium]